MWASPAEPVAAWEDLVVEVLHHLTLALQLLKLVERNLKQRNHGFNLVNIPSLCNHKSRGTRIRQTRRPICWFKCDQLPYYNEVYVHYY